MHIGDGHHWSPLCTLTAAGLWLIQVPAFAAMADEFNVELGQISQLNGATILALGVSSYLGGILANIYGRRIIMLGTLLLAIGGTAWAAFSKCISHQADFQARVMAHCTGQGRFKGWVWGDTRESAFELSLNL